MHPFDPVKPAHPKSVGHFTLIEQIGEGGMGTVYRARDERLGRQVALKLLPRLVADDPQRRSRFEREARAAASLKHPAIATIYEFGEEKDDSDTKQLYLAMELVEGRDLATILHRQKLSIQAVVNIATDLVQGLREAHRHGVVHRDLKPANIRISNEGEVKILDFGLAKLVGANSADSGTGDLPTRTGSVMGTIPYMAPEQVRGEKVDARTDLFSLGVILYKMIGGEPPFSAGNIAQFVLDLERAQPKPIEELRPETPLALSKLLGRLLRKLPDERPQNATEVLEALSSLSSEPPTLISEQISQRHLPGKTSTLPSGLAKLGGALALASLLITGGWWLQGRDLPIASQQRLAVVPFRNLTGDPEAQYLAEGLASLLRSRLSALPDLRVVGQEATLGFSGALPEEQRSYARKLKLEGILEGSLQRSATGLLVVVNFVDAASQTTLWSSEFPASKEGVAAVPTKIARLVANKLFGLEPDDSQLPETVPDAAAFENFLRASQTLSGSADSGSTRTAIALLRQTLKETPSFGLAHLALSKGLWLLHTSQPERELLDEAEREAQEAFRLEPDLPEVKVVMAQILISKGEAEQAVELLETTLDQRPDEERLLSQLENSFSASGNSKLAQETLKRLRKLSDPQTVALELAAAYERTGDFEKTEALLREALQEKPNNAQGLQQMSAFLLKLSRFDDATEFIERGLELSSTNPVALSDLGTLRLLTGDIKGAIEAFDRLPPPILSPVVASNKGTAHYMLGQLDDAERLYRLASLLKPNDPTFRGNLGDSLVQLGRLDSARAEYGNALRLVRDQLEYFADEPSLRSNEVLYLAKLGNCEESLLLMATTEEAVAKDPGLLHRLARSAGICLDRETSLRLLKKTVAAGIPFETIRQLDDEFRFLEDDPEYLSLTGS